MALSSSQRATVAVIMRTRDRPTLLQRALQSVASQSYEDVELCIVNDGGGRDVVEALVAEVSSQFRRPIIRVHHEQSCGREQAINVGVEATTSKYIVLLDDDDTWHSSFLERTVNVLDSTNFQGVAVRTAVVHESLKDGLMTTDHCEIFASQLTEVSLAELIDRNYVTTNSFLYHRSMFDLLGGYDGTLPVLADWDFNIRFAIQQAIAFIDGEPLAFWHRRAGGEGALANSDRPASSHAKYLVRLRDRYLRESLQQEPTLGIVSFLAEADSQRQAELRQSSGDTNDLIFEALKELGHIRIQTDGISEHLSALTAHIDYLNDLQARRFNATVDSLRAEIIALQHGSEHRGVESIGRRALNRIQAPFRAQRS